MKLGQIQEMIDNNKTGTYAGVRFSKMTCNALMKFIEDHNIPNPVPERELHTTLLYSKRYLPNYMAKGKIEPSYIAAPDHFEVWDSKNKKTKVLVLLINCPEMIVRHTFLMREHNALYSFDEYIPHITFSYDVGIGFDLDKLNDINEYIKEIKIVEEYKTGLDD